MKLLITLDFPPEIGGIQRYLFDIVRFTFSSRDLVLAGCSRTSGIVYRELPARVTRVSTPISFLNKKASCIPLFAHFIKIAVTVKDLNEILCGNVYAGIVPWFASFFIRVRYAVYTHGTEIAFLKKRSLRGWLLKKILKKASVLYSNSHFTASLIKEIGISQKVLIVPPRIVVPIRRNENANTGVNAAQAVGREALRILCVGRLIPRKGFAVALDALALLPSDMQWRCVIVGDGPEGPHLRTICIEKGINHRVKFKSALSDEDLASEYDRASIFVLPIAEGGGVEGFGIVLIEAMAHQAPVVAGRTGGVIEVLDDGACGILVKPGDAAELSRAMLRLLTDRRLHERLASAAFERVKRCYAW